MVKLAWNFKNDIDEVGPSIWRQWYGELYNTLWDEFDDENTALTSPFTYQTIYLLKNHGDHEFMDIVSTEDKTETAKDLFLIAFKEATKRLNEIKKEDGDYAWGNYKGTYLGHLLQALPAFSRFDIPIGGDRNIVNATSKNHGPSWRMIVEMTTPPTALGIYPGGQSGNPGSQYYDNFTDHWAAGKYHNLNFLQSNKADSSIIGTQTLKPVSNE
ncbi:penicillin acylase family protein [Flagellimonas meridianipacifica]|uniref:penicillin acylase family protein n=1 Tax=Flagellimonas meridianipacifica TaxID=1080225 RepID=UPI002481E62C|nr:penicillin acylase family protein [Allomuricauda pacifica]